MKFALLLVLSLTLSDPLPRFDQLFRQDLVECSLSVTSAPRLSKIRIEEPEQKYRARAGYGQGLDYQLPCGRLRGSTSAERQSAERAMDRNQAIGKVKYDTEDNLTTWTLPFLVLVGQQPLYNALAVLELSSLNREL